MTKTTRTIAEFEAEGYEGNDVSLETSVLEYGLAWKVDGDDIKFLHRSTNGKGFDCSFIAADTVAKDEWNWAIKDSFLSFLGETYADWNSMPLTRQVSDLVSYYGELEIFGDSYERGFEIEDPNGVDPMRQD